MKNLILSLSLLISFQAFGQGSITLTPNNTTIESKTNQPLIFKTNATERLKIASNGNIGIGQSNPNFILDILEQTSFADVRVKSDFSSASLFLDGINGDATTRFFKNGDWLWSIRNLSGPDNFDIFEPFPSGGHRFTIQNNTGNVGLNSGTPLSRLHVIADGTSGATPLSSEDFFFENNATSYLGIAVPNASETGILFGKTASAASGGVIYSPTNDMSFRTGGNNTRMLITSAGNVGIGANPTAKFTVNGDVAYSGKTNSTTTGTINDFNRAGNSVIRFNGIGSIILNGITGGTDGLIVHIYTTFNITQLSLGNQNGGSQTENQIITGGGVVLFNDGAITLIYDGTSQKWRVLHFQQ